MYSAYSGLLTFFGPIIPVVMLAFLPGQVQPRNFVILIPAVLCGLILYPLWHQAAYGPAVWALGIARGWAHVFAIWDGARGKTMGWHPSRTPGSALGRFRLWVTCWSGGLALVWTVLALWRTLSGDSPDAAILLAFGLLYLAMAGRVIVPGGKSR